MSSLGAGPPVASPGAGGPGAGTADPGFFGPSSVTWRVHADPTMGLAGVRALLLQALHPVAMTGVALHSSFRDDPWGRLVRTAEYVGTVTYGDRSAAERAAARVRGVHRTIRGIVPDGMPHGGQAYRASDPDLLLWVHCTEVSSFLTTAVRCGLRLSGAECDAYYGEQVRAARLVGIRDRPVPDSVSAIDDYFAAIRPELAATPVARAAARFVLHPPMPRWVSLATPARPAWVGLGVLAFSMLPRWARRMYSLPGVPTTDLAATVSGRALRRSLLAVPERVLEGPHRRSARERLALTGPAG